MTSTHPVIAPKKLIEVALPLDDINKACAKEKSIRHGHPSTLHLWWARRPLAAARAVLFAQLVNDPSWKYTEAELLKPAVRGVVTRKRNELFKLISELVLWENSSNEAVLGRARALIQASWAETCDANKSHPDPDVRKLFDPEKLPPFHDPFAGGGAIPLEAQRLGLKAHATDLNPVAVLINKAMIEIPSRFRGRSPVGPIPKAEKQTNAKATEDWSGTRALAEDVRRYGEWLREEATNRIGHLYPKIKITAGMTHERPDLSPLIGQELTVIAWLWARTVKSPNPAFSTVDVPLASTFMLSTNKGREAWVEPVIERTKYRFVVRVGTITNAAYYARGTKLARSNFECLMSKVPISGDYIKAEGQAGRMGTRMMGIIAESEHGRVYLSPTPEMEALARSAKPSARPSGNVPSKLTGGTCVSYGLKEWADLFSARQLVALTTLCDLVDEVRAQVRRDALTAKMPDDGRGLEAGGSGATAYGDAVGIELALMIDGLADRNSSLCGWNLAQSTRGREATVRNVFARQALPMVWDHVEVNILGDGGGSLDSGIRTIYRVLQKLDGCAPSEAHEEDAASQITSLGAVVSTDPPYYDNISYADLSDFFYVWLRRSLRKTLPGLLTTLAVPKAEELVAVAYRHGGTDKAEAFFVSGMTAAMHRIAMQAHPATPVTIYYAFKQSETESTGTGSAGWETFLEAVLRAGFAVVGTWPVRTEREGRSVGIGTNSLASSIILVCRTRARDASDVSRREFLRQLQMTLPTSLSDMTADPLAAVAPVDLAQAAIGPGMAVFSKYESVLEADGSLMTVHSALIHINRAIDDYLAHAEGDLDADSRFCIAWFQQYGFETSAFGEADVLARAKGTSVDGVRDAGVLHSAKGKVRLLRVKEYPRDWDPTTDSRTPIWEACHQMCRALDASEGEAGALLARMPDKQDGIRQLAYRLYTLCERKGWAEEARSYNDLVTSWPAIVEASQKAGPGGKGEQLSLV